MANQPRAFGLIASFPNVKNGEYETTERMKLAAEAIGASCVVYDPFGKVLWNPQGIAEADVEFVISLHFATPKCFDKFTYVALWNPLQFYFDWGYDTYSLHLLSYDDVLSCSSPTADDHVRRFRGPDPDRPWPPFTLYHSLSGPILPPKPAPDRLFYCGINWERLTRAHGRFHDLFLRLDHDDIISLFGPREFLGAQPWAGFRNFRGEIPFDGRSVVNRIHQCGISLVLSSDAHKESALMSSRLFESCAAGAVIICDENPFARRFFGDALLYVDASRPVDEVYRQVRGHFDWIREKPAEALRLAERAQAIFSERFDLRLSLRQLLDGHAARASQLDRRWTPRGARRVLVVRVVPSASQEALDRIERSIRSQRYEAVDWAFVVDSAVAATLTATLGRLAAPGTVTVAGVPDLESSLAADRTDAPRRVVVGVGEAIARILRQHDDADMYCLSTEYEELSSDHLASLVRALEDAPEAGVAVADALHESHLPSGLAVSLASGRSPIALGSPSPMNWTPGRFLFRRATLDDAWWLALERVDRNVAHVLLCEAAQRAPVVATGRASLRVSRDAWRRMDPKRAQYEIQVVRDCVGWSRGPGGTHGRVGSNALSQAITSAYVALFEGRVSSGVRSNIRTPLPDVPAPRRLTPKAAVRQIAALLARKRRDVAIFGCGQAGVQAFRDRPATDVVHFFTDNDPSKHGRRLCGRPIVAPAEILERDVDMVLVASMHYQEIYDQLLDMGVPAEKLEIHGMYRK